MFAQGVEIIFGDANIARNMDTAVCALDSNLTFGGKSDITHNTGSFGGAFHSENSVISFTNFTEFDSNRAFFGGVIYSLYG